ncbi:hypothetical protein J1792_12575 [Streptomyces triculaminicus]|uniref:Integral membrane protein n=2 Tax=Streptomyces TaxID=1883 RepID=A0A939FL72_9ACTN|nr:MULTISPECIES: hypothetical protein [Streptomyces]MBO0653588.1 hypothetical protein [Streptomyces triculaminicus]QSY48412.1 hypothetical protein J3S04_25290 [Streptomyces griseocarneus]
MKEGQQTGQGPRTLRAGVFAAVCVLLAALGHAVMSGTTVPWWAIAVALTVTGSCAWFLAGRERGPLLITLATVGAQTGLHSFFSLAQNVARNVVLTAATPGSGPLPQVPGDATCGGIPPADPASGMGVPPVPLDPGMSMGGMHAGHGAFGMWSAHILVALVCGLWLSGGEQAAFRLGRTLGARLFAPLLFLFHDVPARPGPPRVRASQARAAQRLRQLLYAHVLAQRGPPAALVAVA